MPVTTDAPRRLWRPLSRRAPAGPPRRPGSRHLVPILVTLLVVIGTAVGAVLATAGGKPSGEAGANLVVPGTRPAPARSASPVVPLLGGNVEVGRAVPVASATPSASAGSATTRVAPLHALQQADLLVVAPFSL